MLGTKLIIRATQEMFVSSVAIHVGRRVLIVFVGLVVLSLVDVLEPLQNGTLKLLHVGLSPVQLGSCFALLHIQLEQGTSFLFLRWLSDRLGL